MLFLFYMTTCINMVFSLLTDFLCLLLSDLVSTTCHYLPLRSHGISADCDTVVVFVLGD